MHRYLVAHDYGMGGLWWWIAALSEDDILDTFAEVKVVTDPVWIDRVSAWEHQLQEVSIQGPYPVALADLAEKRYAQRGKPNGLEVLEVDYQSTRGPT